MPTPPAKRRSSATESRRPTSRRAATASSGNPALLIGGVAAAALIVVLVFVFSGRSSGNQGSTPSAPNATPPVSSTPTPKPAAPDLSGGTAKAGKTPDRPAPAIEPSRLAEAEAHYQTAMEKCNEGERARQAGDSTTYIAALQVAFHEMEAQRESIRSYTDWLEEADFGDWAIPADYVVLQRKLAAYDKLFQRAKKLKQAQ